MTSANMEVVGKEGDGRWEKMGIYFLKARSCARFFHKQGG
jgi:hypothetical protein